MKSYLLDTNIILRFANSQSQEYNLIRNTISEILLRGGQCFITSQVIIEFWVVATRPVNVNGLGWTVEQTTQAVQMLISQFDLLAETPDVFSIWLNLVITYNISGKRTHDIHILAVMIAHNISHILTLNPKDFIDVPEITIIHPQNINS
ncbi:PIN domain nuclease [Cylindrospermopsis raciborskii S07]|uniref:Twitching motility protein PilT n=4 Tax=Aphanizomenonaceae TaxID=1892259 RepID=A0A853MA62_9CYAN|nr:type II toxin-antitoxin system VapC family toxin [Cylindrospermopsis raciborskii]EFA70744.1 PilT protein [Cylindrospermopsis raciborskii CS-505]OBU75452.1 twitching motility protein PilT [Cylindrospermopsis raciborskii CS-505]OHY35339.1 twitching motility protein PilT [Cylindrospermopsis raciborskii CS-508]PNJ93933.1 PIN domain nuclease [Cylindrospermopsis raciborskii C04]PNJ94231.1 PIN domain nuclease [Cylindrospermopsis raciborskii C03]